MYSLLPYNTFGIDVSAARFLEYTSVEELKKLIVQGAVTTPFLHIGGGSNLLFTKDYDGLILHSRIEGIEVTEEDAHSVSVRVGAGVVWDDFVAYCVEHGWYGAENLSLDERYSVYAHMALGGFLWSLWAVYKASLGEEFGEYTIIMYRYAKHFYKKCRDIG